MPIGTLMYHRFPPCRVPATLKRVTPGELCEWAYNKACLFIKISHAGFLDGDLCVVFARKS